MLWQNMSIRLSAFVALVTFLPVAFGQECADLDTTGCQLLAAKPDFCTTSPTASTYCPKSCGMCGLQCYHCPNTPVLNYRDCQNTTKCPYGSLCVVRTLHSKDGHYEHLMTCDDQKYCNGFGFGFGSSGGSSAVIGKRAPVQRDISLHCCHSDLCNIPTSVSTTTVKTTTVHIIPPLQSCHRDIVFVVDESGSIGSHGFRQVIGMIKDIVSRIDIGVHSAQVGLMVYDNAPHLQWYLNEYTTKAKLLAALSYVPYHNGTSRTDLALKFVGTDILQFAHGDRRDADNVVVLITDGQASNHSAAVKESLALQQNSNTVVVVGIEHVDQRELVQLASPHHAIQLLDLNNLTAAEDRLVQDLCVR